MLLKSMAAALTVLLVVGQGLEAQEWSRGRTFKKRYSISRGSTEHVPPPDVLVLKDGTRIEAYFLQTYSKNVVYYVQEDERFWSREEVPRSQVDQIERGQYLERDPLEARVISSARKQPVPKREVLAGVFTGTQGRHTKWSIAFHGDINKNLPFAEDATEYGRFTLESNYERSAGGETYAHDVLARGNYFLYAPDTVNNLDWFLVVTDVVESERNYSPEWSFTTRSLPYEAFMVRFSPDRDEFRLEWSNVGESAWAALTQVQFRRSPSTEGRVQPRDDIHVPRQQSRTRPRVIEQPWQRTVDEASGTVIYTRSTRSVAPAAKTKTRTLRPLKGARKLRARRLGRWGKPLTRWNG